MTTTFKNASLYYQSVGDAGEPIVLLHGFLESNEIWDDFVGEFSPKRQVIRIDLPGHGKSESIAPVHTMELFAEAVAHVLQELEIEKVDVLGHSMGGYVVLAFLEAYREKVNRIILLNSNSRGDSEERQKNRDRSSELVRKNKEGFVRVAISNLLSERNYKKFNLETELLKKRALKFPVEGIIAALQGMKIRTDRTRVLKQFDGKKFLLAGEEDPLIDFQEIKSIAEDTQSELHSFSGGHLSYLENRMQFIKTMQFIE